MPITTATTIIVIEDDHQIRRVVEGYLVQADYRVIGLVIAVMQRDQIVCPHITLLRRIVQIRNFVKVLAVMCQQGVISAQ